MLLDLIIGVGTMSLCLLMQSAVLVKVLRYYVRHEKPETNTSTWSNVLVINGVMTLLVIGNLAQIAIWAILFLLLGEFDTFPAAAYHSAVNFATLGYGDVVMSEQNRFLGPMEAINGVLMVGVSTAALWALSRKRSGNPGWRRRADRSRPRDAGSVEARRGGCRLHPFTSRPYGKWGSIVATSSGNDFAVGRLSNPRTTLHAQMLRRSVRDEFANVIISWRR